MTCLICDEFSSRVIDAVGLMEDVCIVVTSDADRNLVSTSLRCFIESERDAVVDLEFIAGKSCDGSLT